MASDGSSRLEGTLKWRRVPVVLVQHRQVGECAADIEADPIHGRSGAGAKRGVPTAHDLGPSDLSGARDDEVAAAVQAAAPTGLDQRGRVVLLDDRGPVDFVRLPQQGAFVKGRFGRAVCSRAAGSIARPCAPRPSREAQARRRPLPSDSRPCERTGG